MSPRTLLCCAALAVWVLAPARAALAQPAATGADPHAGHQQEAQPSPDTADPHTGHDMPAPPAPADAADPHAGHTMPAPAAATDAHQHEPAQDGELPPFIPRLTDEDRRAAFPEGGGHHAAHDHGINYFVLLDQLEWQRTGDGGVFKVDTTGWIGRDRNRVWFRAEGDGENGGIGEGMAHVLFGHQFSRWWDVVGGVRQDVEPGPAQTWAAFGVQGLAPYWFEVEATAYLGTSGQVQGRLHVEYDLRVTNRWIVQPLGALQFSANGDQDRQVDAGLNTSETGARLRYLVRREFAPYVGVTWSRRHGDLASHARAHGEQTGGARLAIGARMWF